MKVSQLQFGITPIRYLREVRIGVARHLLESSDVDLSQIAAKCGFYDQSHLIRITFEHCAFRHGGMERDRRFG